MAKKKEETKVEKKLQVQKLVGEARDPVLRGGAFDVLSPQSLRLKAGDTARISLGVKFGHPVQLFEYTALTARGVHATDGLGIYDADQPLTLTLKNTSKTDALLEPGERLARLVCLDSSEWKVG